MASEAAVSLVACMLGALLFYGPWQWICTDWIRQTCFEARDKIFDMAAEGRLDFGSDEYKAIRRAIESEIRFAHHLTLPYLIVVGFSIRCFRPDLVKSVRDRELESRRRIADVETRQEIEKILADMNRWVLYFMMLKSPLVLFLPTIVVVPMVMCFAAAKAYLRILTSAAGTVIRITSSFGGADGPTMRGAPWSSAQT